MTESPSGNTTAAEYQNETGTNGTRRAKRTRVALACEFCKRRKQKCDGQTPSCTNCINFDATCRYIKPKPPSRNHDPYIKVAEERVSELERALAKHGVNDEGRARWEEIQNSRSAGNTESNEPNTLSSTQRPHKRQCLDNFPPDWNVEVDTDGQSRRRKSSTVVDILRDLSLEASGGYIGASSSITISRMVGSLVKSKVESGLDNHGLRGEEGHLSPRSLCSDNENLHLPETGSMSDHVAEKLLGGYLKHIATRWPILHSTYIRSLHARRHALENPYEKSMLHLVYATGGRFLETTGETGAFFPDRHHAAGMEYLDEILQYHDIRSVQILILLAIYSLRAPKGPGAWTYIGLAMRSCIDLGLHRKTPKRHYPIFEIEMRKRIFWTCYCLDRQISIILGRPFAISDRDIDVSLPLDVDESVNSKEGFETALQTSLLSPVGGAPPASTSLSCFIHICRLRVIESQIQQSVYRVDEAVGSSESEVDAFIDQLENWKNNIPGDARHVADKPTTKTDTHVIDGYGYYMVYYYKCMRFLLHPTISAENSNTRFLTKCAAACGDVCQTYKKLHQNIPVGFSLMALHSVFLAGLTLVYCAWISPQEVFSIKASNDMNACSIVLYIITERWPGARKYRDIYEAIKQSLLDSVQESEYQPRRAMRNIYPDFLPPMAKNDEGSAEVTKMVHDMAGQPTLVEDFDFMHTTIPGDYTPPAPNAPMEFSQTESFDDLMFRFDMDAINAFDFDMNLGAGGAVLL